MQYCVQYVEIYGKDYCTPNLHLHGHLQSCIKDYGPVYAFWLFGFERLNGVLGSCHLNNHAISVQIMRHFNSNMQTYHGMQNWPDEYKEVSLPLVSHRFYNKGSLMFKTLESNLQSLSSSDMMQLVKPLPPVKESVFEQHIQQCLLESLEHHFSESSINLLSIYTRCKAIKIGSFILGSEKSKYTTSSRLLATVGDQIKLVLVNYYAKCSIRFSDNTIQVLWLAAVSCYFISLSGMVWPSCSGLEYRY